MIRSRKAWLVISVVTAALAACDGPSTSPTSTDAAHESASSDLTRLSRVTTRGRLTPFACTSTDPELTVSCSQPNWSTYSGLTTGSLPVTISVTNVNLYNESYNISCTGFGIVTGCTPKTSLPWTPLAGTTSYSFNTTMTGDSGTGGINVTFTDAANSAKYSTGTVNLSAHWWEAVGVAPHTSSITVTKNKDTTFTFRVSNYGWNAEAYQFTITCSGGPTNCLVDNSYKGTPPFTSTGVLPMFSTGSVTVDFKTGSTSPETIRFTAADTGTESPMWPTINRDSGTVTITTH